MQKYLYLFSFLLLGTFGFTQTEINRCHTVEAIEHRNNLYPGYIDQVNQVYEDAKKKAASATNRDDVVYRIPVVVHIVYLGTDDNLADSLVYSQIDVLNEDYRRLNADAVNTRDEFLSVAGDAMIEFYLAEIDPDGNPTTGITRTMGTPGFLGFSLTPFDNGVKHADTGGVDAWDTANYLNIWVCDMSILGAPAILGFAYPPADLPGWPDGSNAPTAGDEGVVIQYQAFGRNNPNAVDVLSILNRGRTTTHEVGHFLGLRHIWGDGDCTMDDGLTDTPNAADNAQQVCDWTKNTCTDTGQIEYPDMIENYMDYAADSCMNMFTLEQIGIMRSVLEGPRLELVEGDLTSTATLFNKVNATLFPNPTSGVVHLQIDNPEKIDYQISIQNYLGQTVLHNTSSTSVNGHYEFDLSNLENGVYFVNLQSGNHNLTKKIVLNK